MVYNEYNTNQWRNCWIRLPWNIGRRGENGHNDGAHKRQKEIIVVYCVDSLELTKLLFFTIADKSGFEIEFLNKIKTINGVKDKDILKKDIKESLNLLNTEVSHS